MARLRSGAEDVRRLFERTPEMRELLVDAMAEAEPNALRNAVTFTVEWLDEIRSALYFDTQRREKHDPLKNKRQ